jgi:NADPH2:quinone reductase
MLGYQLMNYVGPQGLQLAHDLPEPTPSASEVLLDIHAIGINFPDLLATQGLYQLKAPLPFTPGCEIAGIVREAPSDSGWTSGQRAAAFGWQGGYAETAVVPLRTLMAVPDGTALDAAAAMVVDYHTVLFALARRGAVRDGETVMVLGAGGGIGTAALQVAKGLGATVVGGVANAAQAEIAQAAGADHVIVLAEGFAQSLRELTSGRGVDVVLDPFGDWLFDEALRALAPEGRILVVGFAAGQIPNLKVNRLLLRNAAAVGVAWGAFLDVDPSWMAISSERLDDLLANGFLRPHIGARYRFDQIPEALETLQRGAISGKAIVRSPRYGG